MPAPDFTDTDKTALIALLRQAIFADPYPLSPRVRQLRTILAKLEPPAAPPMLDIIDAQPPGDLVFPPRSGEYLSSGEPVNKLRRRRRSGRPRRGVEKFGPPSARSLQGASMTGGHNAIRQAIGRTAPRYLPRSKPRADHRPVKFFGRLERPPRQAPEALVVLGYVAGFCLYGLLCVLIFKGLADMQWPGQLPQ